MQLILMVILLTVTLKKVFVTATKVYIFTLNSDLKTEKKTNTMEDGLIILKMELEHKLILGREDTKDTGKMERDTEKEFLFMIIKTYIQDNGKMEKKMDKVHTFLKKLE